MEENKSGNLDRDIVCSEEAAEKSPGKVEIKLKDNEIDLQANDQNSQDDLSPKDSTGVITILEIDQKSVDLKQPIQKGANRNSSEQKSKSKDKDKNGSRIEYGEEDSRKTAGKDPASDGKNDRKKEFSNDNANEGFNKTVTSGLFWTALSFGLWKVISLVSIFILARLLSPEDFGLVGIAVIVIGLIRMFQDMGVGCALIYRKDASPELINTAFYMILASGIAFALFGFFSAEYAAAYFNNISAKPVLQALSINIIIVSIGTVPGFLLTKELQFKKRIGPEFVAALAQAITSISMALLGFGVWSLVIGDIVNRAVASAGAWIVHPWRPQLVFKVKLARELFSYSKFMVASSISSFATSNIDNIVVARMLGAASLGFYSLAYRVASLPSTLTFFIISKVTFPVFSKLQDDRKRLAAAFLRTVKYLAFASLPVGIAMFMLAPALVGLLLGSKWDNSVAPLQALVVYGIFTSIIWQAIEIYKATGKTSLSFRSEAIRLAILVPLAILGAALGGIYGVAIAQSVTVAIASIFYFRPIMRSLGIGGRDLAEALTPSLVPSAGVFLALWAINKAFDQDPIMKANYMLLLATSLVAVGLVLFLSLVIIGRGRVPHVLARILPSRIAIVFPGRATGSSRIGVEAGENGSIEQEGSVKQDENPFARQEGAG